MRASVALLDAVASDLESSAWVIVVTRRDVAGGWTLADHDHLRIELGALSREDTLTLALTTSEAAQLPPHVLNLAADRSGGSPSFLLDLLAAAADGHLELPEGVGAATMARIDALDPRDGVVVRRAAVLGMTFKPRRLLDVLDSDTAPADDGFWDRLSTVFVREADGQVRFRHPAVQEAAYASLPFKLRRQLHMTVGLRLERDLRRRGGRRSGGALTTLRAGRGPRTRAPLRDGRRPAGNRAFLARGCRAAVSQGDRRRTRVWAR